MPFCYPGEEVTAFCRGRDLPVFRGLLEKAPVEPRSLDGLAIWAAGESLDAVRTRTDIGRP